MFRFVVEICFVFLQLNERVQCSQSLSVPAYRLVDAFQTDTIDNISTVFCPTSIVFQSIESISIFNAMNFKQIEIFLFGNERRSIGSPIKNGSIWILNKPDPSLCYSIVFTKTNPTENLNVDQINVSFLYDFQPTNNETILRLTQTDSSSTVCGSTICRNGGLCPTGNFGRMSCQCDPSDMWLGDDCSKPNPCLWNPCSAGRQCFYFQDARYYCACDQNSPSSNCQTMTTMTNSVCQTKNPCLNGATCRPANNFNRYLCDCLPNFTGDNCQTRLNSTTTMNQCGVASTRSPIDFDRIINGQPVSDNTWPWIVSLQTVTGSHFCGGSLISPYHILTAAHCFDSSSVSVNEYRVVAGLLNLKQIKTKNVQQLSIDRIFRHEYYSSTSLVNDIAVIKLRTPVQWNSFVQPICLPKSDGSQDPKLGQSVQIAGWGYTSSYTKQLANQLQQATIEILPMNDNNNNRAGCNVWIRRGYQISDKQQICAMSRDTRTDSCQGDSGGPLIRDFASKWFIFGIVSFGDSICGSSTAAGVYTRVSAYIDWIQNKMRL